MKHAGTEANSFDAVAERDDVVEVEIQQRHGHADGYNVYVNVNGVTVLRIGQNQNLKVILPGGFPIEYKT